MRHFIRKFFILVLVFALGFTFLLCSFEHRSAAQDQELLWPPVGLIAERPPISLYNLYPQFADHYLAYNTSPLSRLTYIPTMFQSEFQIMSTAPTVFPAQSLSTAEIPTSLSIGYATQQESILKYSADVWTNQYFQRPYTSPNPYKALSMMTPQPLVDMIVSHILESRVFIFAPPTIYGSERKGWYINYRDPILQTVDPVILRDIVSDLEGYDYYNYFFY